ncbi:hypothetical protein A3717_38055, partial [Alcanivorax sp. HI0013]
MNLLLLRISYALLLFVGITGLFSLALVATDHGRQHQHQRCVENRRKDDAGKRMNIRRRQATWLCFILLFYFCGYAVQLLDPPPVRTL